MSNEVLTTAQAAEYLGISINCLRQWKSRKSDQLLEATHWLTMPIDKKKKRRIIEKCPSCDGTGRAASMYWLPGDMDCQECEGVGERVRWVDETA
ncbi:MAG: hypothetical protein WBB28_24885 [Crinalium sp.]